MATCWSGTPNPNREKERQFCRILHHAKRYERGENAMKHPKPASRTLVAVPTLLGILSVLSFLIYLYSANHSPYRYIGIIHAGPILSLLGVVLSILTRKSRTAYPLLWTSGLVLCSLGLVICVFTITVLTLLILSFLHGA